MARDPNFGRVLLMYQRYPERCHESCVVPGYEGENVCRAFIMHSDEALLAIVFILFFHFYNEHLRSEEFPMNYVWLTGKIPTEELKHKYPLEYEYQFGEKAD